MYSITYGAVQTKGWESMLKDPYLGAFGRSPTPMYSASFRQNYILLEIV